MATLWTETEAAQVTGGQALGHWSVSSISIDTRTLQPGGLFVALTGGVRDGHDFVANALAKGAGAALVSSVPEGIPADAPLLKVDDTKEALIALGTARRDALFADVVAVTGSVGKTSTKDALSIACAALGETYATEGNYNNDLGVPITLMRTPKETEYLICELGMNHAGEIEELTQWVCPHVALITAIAPVHLEFFESVEAIADAKAEIFLGVEQGGVAVIPGNSPYTERLRQAAADAGVFNIRTVGVDEQCTSRLISYDIKENQSHIIADISGQKIEYIIGMIGEHQALNSVSVLTVIDALGGDLTIVAKSLADWSPARGRGKVMHTGLQGKSITVIDDSYNASPASVQAALTTLSKMSGRKVAVLGDMKELGVDEARYHAELAQPIADAGVKCVITLGDLMKHLHEALQNSDITSYHYDTIDEVIAAMSEWLEEGDVVLVKGSNSMGMSAFVNELESVEGKAA